MPGRTNLALVALAGLVLLCRLLADLDAPLPKADIGSQKHIFVERRLADNYGVAEEIARQLRAMGYDASSGALTMMPGERSLSSPTTTCGRGTSRPT